jgi:hypothetical protein
MYNNDITYDKKWDTPENLAARAKIAKKFFDRSVCCPDCPTSWAPEVLELLETLDKELGIARNTQTMGGYNIRNSLGANAIIESCLAAWNEFKHTFITAHDPESYLTKRLAKQSILQKLKRPVDAFLNNIKYSLRAFKVQHINVLINKLLKPKIHLSQIKEKYGELVIYFSSSDVHEEYIENLIKRTEIKLAIKGAYYPVETFWGSTTGYSVGTDYRPDTITTKQEADGAVYVTKTTYRNLMKEMGLDLKEIELKYHEYKKKMEKMP